jgi:hypothetical protein
MGAGVLGGKYPDYFTWDIEIGQPKPHRDRQHFLTSGGSSPAPIRARRLQKNENKPSP